MLPLVAVVMPLAHVLLLQGSIQPFYTGSDPWVVGPAQSLSCPMRVRKAYVRNDCCGHRMCDMVLEPYVRNEQYASAIVLSILHRDKYTYTNVSLSVHIDTVALPQRWALPFDCVGGNDNVPLDGLVGLSLDMQHSSVCMTFIFHRATKHLQFIVMTTPQPK